MRLLKNIMKVAKLRELAKQKKRVDENARDNGAENAVPEMDMEAVDDDYRDAQVVNMSKGMLNPGVNKMSAAELQADARAKLGREPNDNDALSSVSDLSSLAQELSGMGNAPWWGKGKKKNALSGRQAQKSMFKSTSS